MQIKICERCFLCHSVVLCKACNKCQKCCHNSTCRGSSSRILANLAGFGGRPESSFNSQGGLPPPLSDPTQTDKISHSHKLFCQSSQEQLPVRGIASAYRQKCCRTGQKPNLTRVLQPTLSGPQTTKQVATYTGPKPSESLPQGGELQDGDTGNHQNLSPTRGVGYVHRLQGRLLPHPYTGTVQEISQIPCPGSDIPVQGSTLWSVRSPHGIHCSDKGSKTDGHTEGYKNPPALRRLVGKSQVPPSLSPAYPNPSTTVSRPWLAGEFRKIGTGTQGGFQLCGLPVRPQIRPGPTHTGPVAKPTGKDSVSAITTGLSGPAVHVPDRSLDSHRKTSSPRPVTHEAHPMASQKQLAGTRITREGDPNTQISAPTPSLVVGGKQCTPRSTITPIKTCSANFYRRIKRRLGRSLKRAHCKRVLIITGDKAAYKLSGTKSSLSGLKRVPKPLYRENSSGSNRQHYSSVLHKQGRRYEVGSIVCPTVENLDLVHQETSDPQSPPHSRPLKCGSGQAIQTRPDHSDRMVSPPRGFSSDLQQVAPSSDRPFCHQIQQQTTSVSPVPDPLATAVDALSLPWYDLDAYAFPPTAILSKVVEKLLDSPCNSLILIAPGWPNMPWFWDLVEMSSQVPLSLPALPNLLTQPFNQIPHRNLTNLNLHAWLLEPQQSKNRASLRQWQQELRLLKEDQPDQSMRQSGPFLQSGATLIRWTSGHHL